MNSNVSSLCASAARSARANTRRPRRARWAAPAAAGASAHNSFLHQLRLSATDRVIGGVCGGLGAHTGIPSWAWRVMFSISVLYFGIGLLFYVLLWIFIPRDSAPPVPPATG